MSDYDVRAILSVKDSGFTSSMESAISTLDKLDTSAGTTSNNAVAMGTAFGVASKLISAAFSAIQSSMGNAISRFDTLNQFPKVMEQIGFSAEDAAAASEKLVAGIQGLPTSLDEITANTQSIALLTGDLDEATDIALALNDAFLASGSSSYDASRGLAQYSQMLAAGTVDMQSWRVLLETMGVALNDVAAEFGYTGESAKNDLYTALKSGEITFDELNATLINLDNGLSTASDSFVAFSERALTGSEGIATSFQNIKTAITTGLANMLTAIDTALGDAGLGSIASNLDSLKVAVKNTFNVINSVISGVVKVIAPLLKNLSENVNLVVIAVGALATKFIALKAIDTVKSTIDKLKTSTKEAASTLKTYNETLEKYGSKANAAKAAEEAMQKAQEASTEAAKAQKDADDALIESKEKYVAALQAEMEWEKTVKEYGAESVEAAEAATAVKEAQTAASEAKATALEKEAAAQSMAATAEQEAVVAEEASVAANTLNNTQISLKTALLAALSGEMSIAEAAQAGFNAVMSANPIGAVITAVTTLISLYSALTALLGKSEHQEYIETQEEIRESLEETNAELEESTAEHKSNISAIKDSAQTSNRLISTMSDLQGKIEKANASGEDSSALVAEMKSKLEQLNDELGEEAFAYDETANALSASAEAMEAYVELQAKQNEQAELVEHEAEVNQQLADTKQQLADTAHDLYEKTEAYNEAQERYLEAVESGSGATWGLKAAMDSAREEMEETQLTYDDLHDKVGEYTVQYEEAADAVVAATDEMTAAEEAWAEAQYAANEAAIESGHILYEDLTETNQSLVDSLNDTWNSYYEANTNMWDKLVDETSFDMDELIETLRYNQDAEEKYAQNLGKLRDYLADLGIDSAVVDQFEAMGYESANEVAAFVADVESGGNKIVELAEVYGEGGTKAGEDYVAGLGESAAANLPEAVQDLVGTTETGIADAIRNADWAAIEEAAESGGEAITEGITWGITGSERNVTDATIGVATDSINGYEGEINCGSPSKVFMEFGEAEMEGLALGITENADQAVSALEDVVTQSAEAFEGSSESYTAIGEAIANGIASGISGQSKTVSTAISAIVTDIQKLLNAVNLSAYGSNAITTYVSGLTNVKSKVTSLVSTLITEVKNAFNAVSLTSYGTNAITSYYSGMNSVKSKVTTLISTLITDIKNKLNAVSLTSYGKNAIASYASGMESKISSVKSQSQAAANAAKSGVENLSLYSYGANAMQGFINGMESKRSAVQSKASSIANAAASTISSALKIGSPSKLTKKYGKWTAEGLAIGIAKGEGKVENEVEDLASVVQSLADVVDVTSSIKEAFSGLSTTLASSGVDAIQGFVSGVKSMQAAVTEVADVTSTVKTAFASLSTTLTSSGVSAIQGFIDGMKSMQQAVTSTALSLAQCASSAISAALKIGSPSKLLRQYGEWTGEGFELGLESTISGIKDVARDIADTAVEFLTPSTSTWDFGELAIAGGMTFGVDSLSDDIARLTEALNSRPIQVETSLEIDGREFATATSGYISDEIDRTQARASRKSGVK